MQTVEMMITPSQAIEWLETKNTRNRTLSMKRACMYAGDMVKGKWHQTHQGISFYDDGVLADGQTRLKAIAIANMSIKMLVTFGLHQSSSIGIDNHRMRSTANQIEIDGRASWIGKNEIAIARQLLRISGKSDNLSTDQIIAYCEAVKPSLVFAVDNLRVKSKSISPASVKAAVSCAYGVESDGDLIDFCGALTTGIMKHESQVAAIRLREKLLQDGSAMQASGTGRLEALMLTQRAIKAFCEKQQIKRLVLPEVLIYKPYSPY
jgi:hypothetical protein